MATKVSPDSRLPSEFSILKVMEETMLSTNRLQTASRPLIGAAALLLATVLFALPAAAQRATPTNLTSDIPSVGAFNDTHLVNPWGLSVSPGGPWWVSDNGTGLSTLYIATGAPQGLVVTIPGVGGNPGTPTGTVYNG